MDPYGPPQISERKPTTDNDKGMKPNPVNTCFDVDPSVEVNRIICL